MYQSQGATAKRCFDQRGVRLFAEEAVRLRFSMLYYRDFAGFVRSEMAKSRVARRPKPSFGRLLPIFGARPAKSDSLLGSLLDLPLYLPIAVSAHHQL